MKLIVTAILLALPGVAMPQLVNIGRTSAGSSNRESLRVPPNGVVFVSLPSGQRALIQFTAIDEDRAKYRWKYRRGPGSQVELGNGTVVQKYERLPTAEPRSYEVLPLPGHDVIIRAGEIRAEWSSGGDSYCYVYFNPQVASASLSPASRFEAEP